MIRLNLFFILFSSFTVAQDIDSTLNPLHQTENIIKFADYLFCDQDYLRSANEYLRIDEKQRNEMINFKIAVSLSSISNFSRSKSIFKLINESSPYYNSSRLEIMKILFIEEKYSELRNYFLEAENHIHPIEKSERKLYFLSYLKNNEEIPSFDDFIKPFDDTELEKVSDFYQLKLNPPSKNPVLASALSAIIPGAGKFYTGEFSDGIFALITTGIFSFLAYDNFKANHDFRGWLFSSLAVMFYGGNIYGSFASAQIYNARIKYEFNLNLDSFLKLKNYFIPQYDFCK